MKQLPWALVASFVACNPSASPSGVAPQAPASAAVPPAPSAARVGEHPDAASLAALALQANAQCKDTCCVVKEEWVGDMGPPLPAEDAQVVRGVLASSSDPVVLTLALRALSRSAQIADAPLLARFVDDTRASTLLPTERPQQAAARCYPVTWQAQTPSSEALRILGRVQGRTFEGARDYHAWAATHADPDASFEVWNARLSRQEPPPPELVARLRAKDAVLFVQVMAFRCAGDDRCGVSPGELAQAIKTTLGPRRALQWLDGSEPTGAPEDGHTSSNLLAAGEMVFTAADLPALEKMWVDRRFKRSLHHAELGILLARMKPAEATKYWREILAHGPQEIEPSGLLLGLREVARRDPVGMEAELRSWVDVQTEGSEDAENAAAIWAGMAEADPGAASVFGRLMSKPVPRTSARSLAALWQAAAHFGCRDLGEERALTPRALKGQSKADYEVERARAEAAQTTLLRSVQKCAATLRAQKKQP